MQFKELRCLIPRLNTQTGIVGPCNRYLCDIEANAPATVRCSCKNDHAQPENINEFRQDAAGVISYRFLQYDPEDAEYSDDGVRVPMTVEEVEA